MVARFDADGQVLGYHMNCRSPGHFKCTKEISTTVTGGASQARRLLKSWVLLAPAHKDRQSHMARALRDELLQAIRNSTLMTEDELDMLAPSSVSAETQAPFRRVGLLERQTELAQPQPHSLLGEQGEASQELHAEMEQMAATGAVPITTLLQRRRNRLANTSFYEVPANLLPALQGDTFTLIYHHLLDWCGK